MARRNKRRRTSTLHYDEDEVLETGEYYIRGGVCWPIRKGVGAQERYEGFIVLGLQHVESGVIYVVEESPFVCIDHVVDSTGRIEFEGISTWLNRIWSKYYANTFCYWQSEDVHRRHLLARQAIR